MNFFRKEDTEMLVSDVENLPSLARYARVKHWGIYGESFSSGEIDRLGAWVSEGYLDDTSWSNETRLKSLCRANHLPHGSCIQGKGVGQRGLGLLALPLGVVRTPHFVLDCPLFSAPRRALWQWLAPRRGRSLGGHPSRVRRSYVLYWGSAPAPQN